MIELNLIINDLSVVHQKNTIYHINDRDSIQFFIRVENSLPEVHLNKVELLLEDFNINFVLSSDARSLQTYKESFFRESFGLSTLRIFIDNFSVEEIIFNVSTNQEKFNNIKSMMSYLLENNERILDICFSRTKYQARNDGDKEPTYESVISLAEKFISNFNNNQKNFETSLKNIIVPIKEVANDKNFHNINPYDVLENLGEIFPGYSPDSMNIFGKIYSLQSIKRENYSKTFNLEENKVLLAGLISIRYKLDEILDSLRKGFSQLTFEKEYEVIKTKNKMQNNLTIDDLYMQLTTAGMENRILAVLECIDGYLYYFKERLKISFEGFLRPKITPFVRKSSYHLNLFSILDEWYSLGNPKLGVNHNLTKIRSTSKIYELFTLYKLIDCLVHDGWSILRSIEHPFFKNFLPSQIEFRKDNTFLSLYYEKQIYSFNKDTIHNDIVSLVHGKYGRFNYYNPDFVIAKKLNNITHYYILDSKYSSSQTLEQYQVIDKLYDKYFTNLAVYDEDRNVLTTQNIISVNAIHPFGTYELSKWKEKSLSIIPDVSSILLSKEQNNLDYFIKLLNIR